MDAWWQQKFNEHRDLAAKQGREFKLIFIGDSITELMVNARDTMQRLWAPYHPQEFGISGDMTEHVLWRLRSGELDGVAPKVAVLLIGTNNFGDNSDAEIAQGVKLIVAELRMRMPDAKVLVLGLLPRGAMPNNEYRKRVTGVNALLSGPEGVADGKHVFYLDVGNVFLQPNGVMNMPLMPDQLHPSPPGYDAMFNAMKPTVDKLLTETEGVQ